MNQTEVLEHVLCLGTGYMFGCFLTAELVARKVAHKSASEIGSGNPGMANIMARLGKKAGLIVLAGDFAKTVLAFAVSGLLIWFFFYRGNPVVPDETAGTSSIVRYLYSDVVLWTGLGVLTGHNYPFWKRFKGGKGVTVTVTWILFFLPLWGILCSVAGGIITLITGYLPLGAFLITLFFIPFAFLYGGTASGIIMSISFILMVIKHYPGLMRILNGTEKREFHKN